MGEFGRFGGERRRGGAMVEDTVAPSREARATLIPSHECI